MSTKQRTPKESPILFSGPMVRAIYANEKTQTRRLVKDASGAFWDHGAWTPTVERGGIRWDCDDGVHVHWMPRRSPKGYAGDRLWVRETWAPMSERAKFPRVAYRANMIIQNPVRPSRPFADLVPWPVDDTGRPGHSVKKWRPSIFMPRWASRLNLEITGVRLERLHDISDEDIAAEGVTVEAVRELLGERWGVGNNVPPRTLWQLGWSAINGRASWAANPWVWAISFKRRGEIGIR